MCISTLHAQLEIDLQSKDRLKPRGAQEQTPIDIQHRLNTVIEQGSNLPLPLALQIALDSARSVFGIMGASAAMIMPGEVLWLGTSGHSATPYDSVTSDMLFGIASNTKTFIAATLLQLQEEGILSLDDPLHKWLPTYERAQYQYIDSNITIRQLLNHTSGIWNYTDLWPVISDSLQADPNKFWMPESILTTFIRSRNFAPGARYSYCNTGYILAGMIIRAATHTMVTTQLHQRFLTPLNLNNTFLAIEDDLPGDRAHPWGDFSSGGNTHDLYDFPLTGQFSMIWTAGAMFSTPENMVRWVSNLYGGKVLKDSSLGQMLTLSSQSAGFYGLGVMRDVTEGNTFYGHGGIWIGYDSEMWYCPAATLSFAYAGNTNYPLDYTVYPFLLRAYLHHVASIDKKYYLPGIDTVKVRTLSANPNAHPLIIKAYFETGGSVVDSSLFYDDGFHHDSLAGDAIWGAMWKVPQGENFYNINVGTIDLVDSSSFTLNHVALFTTAGPMVVDSASVTRRVTKNYAVRLYMRNKGVISTITTPSIYFTSYQPGIKQFSPSHQTLPDFRPDTAITLWPDITVTADTGTFAGVFGLRFDFQQGGWTYWSDSVQLIAGSIHLNTPNGGEVRVGTTTDTITWTSSGIANVRIEMSTDNGVSWPVIIAGNAPAVPGLYIYTVPDLPSAQCRIRVRDVTFPLLNDISDTTFTTVVGTRVSAAKGWNLLSVPLHVDDFRADGVYPTRVMPVLGYTDHYLECDTLECGRGYWVRLSSPQNLFYTGQVLDSTAIDVRAGWNMIGSISVPIATASITSNPGGIVTSQFFGYEGVYIRSDSIRPGKGYWVNVGQDGKLILGSSTSALNAANSIRIVPTEEQPPPAPVTENAVSMTPKTYALEQNYPNPFNPSTTISYRLPKQSHVTLKVFDMLGREVATLVNGIEPPGYKSINFSVQRLASGVYYYRIIAGTFTETKKLQVLR